MKVGDLVKCIWQPRCGSYDNSRQCVLTMKHTIKGELGIIAAIDKHYHHIMFPQLGGYTHPLAIVAFEVIDD